MPFTLDPPAPVVQAVPQATVEPPDLLSDLPPFERGSYDIQAVLRACGNELARLEAARRDLISNFFPLSADTLLRFFEQMLGLPVESPQLSLAARQASVQAFMQQLKSAGTGLEWEDSITALIGTSWTYKEHDPADGTSPPAYTVLIRIPFSASAPVPVGLAAVSGAAGTPTGTFYYAVSARTVYGETLPCAPQSVTVAAHKVNVTWTAGAAPVIGYNVYRGTSPTTLKLLSSPSTNSFTDDGTLTPGVAPPTTDSSSSPQAATVLQLARAITPANIVLEVGFTAGFLVGISEIGVDAL